MAISILDDEAQPNKLKGLSEPEVQTRIKLYKISFSGDSYELVLHPHEGRIVVHDVRKSRREKYGEMVQPHIGHVLYAVGTYTLPLGMSFKRVIAKLRTALSET